jgi:hypothetical protein
MKLINNVVGLFVGENSKKRQMGIMAALACSALYYVDVLTVSLYESLMGLIVLWVGAAYSAKLTKLGKAIKDIKKVT